LLPMTFLLIKVIWVGFCIYFRI